MKTIVKYPLEITDRVVLQLPADAKILLVGNEEHNSLPLAWFEVDTDKPLRIRSFRFYSGGDVRIEGEHIASFKKGSVMLHLYEITPKEPDDAN